MFKNYIYILFPSPGVHVTTTDTMTNTRELLKRKEIGPFLLSSMFFAKILRIPNELPTTPKGNP